MVCKPSIISGFRVCTNEIILYVGDYETEIKVNFSSYNVRTIHPTSKDIYEVMHHQDLFRVHVYLYKLIH